MRRGAANGNTHVAKIKILKSHPDNANQRKKIVYKKEGIKDIKQIAYTPRKQAWI